MEVVASEQELQETKRRSMNREHAECELICFCFSWLVPGMEVHFFCRYTGCCAAV